MDGSRAIEHEAAEESPDSEPEPAFNPAFDVQFMKDLRTYALGKETAANPFIADNFLLPLGYGSSVRPPLSLFRYLLLYFGTFISFYLGLVYFMGSIGLRRRSFALIC